MIIMFKKTSLVVLMALVAATAFAQVAVAQEPDVCREAAGSDRYAYYACKQATEGGDPCAAALATGSREAYAACRSADPSFGCDRTATPSPGEPRSEDPREPGDGDSDCFGPQRCPGAVQRESTSREQASESTGSCSEAACRHVTLYNVDPERGDDCHEVLCKNVPAVIETIKVPFMQTVGGTDGLGGILEATPATKIVKERTVRIVKSAAFWCESSTGTGSPGSPNNCQQVLDTPAADAGFDPFVKSDFDNAGANECSWVKSPIGGPTYVDDDDNTLAQATSGSCDQYYTMYAAFGAERERYHLRWQC